MLEDVKCSQDAKIVCVGNSKRIVTMAGVQVGQNIGFLWSYGFAVVEAPAFAALSALYLDGDVVSIFLHASLRLRAALHIKAKFLTVHLSLSCSLRSVDRVPPKAHWKDSVSRPPSLLAPPTEILSNVLHCQQQTRRRGFQRNKSWYAFIFARAHLYRFAVSTWEVARL